MNTETPTPSPFASGPSEVYIRISSVAEDLNTAEVMAVGDIAAYDADGDCFLYIGVELAADEMRHSYLRGGSRYEGSEQIDPHLAAFTAPLMEEVVIRQVTERQRWRLNCLKRDWPPLPDNADLDVFDLEDPYADAAPTTRPCGQGRGRSAGLLDHLTAAQGNVTRLLGLIEREGRR